MRGGIDVIIPGLCGPLPAHSSELPVEHLQPLADLLGCVCEDAENGHLEQILERLRCNELPVAAVSLAAAGDAHASAYCMRVEPVHLKADMDHAILVDTSIAGITPAEREQLLQELNAHFAVDDIEIVTDDEGGWYIVSDTPPGIDTVGIVAVIARNVNLFLPQGDNASFWKRFMNESQMLLHQSEVNRRRMESGLMPLNSLWLEADTGTLQQAGLSAAAGRYELIAGQNALHRGLAAVTGTAFRPLQQIAAQSLPPGRSLLLDDSMMRAAAAGDVAAWLQQLQQVLDWLQPLAIEARRRHTGLYVYPCSGRRYRINRKRLFDIFCRPSADSVVVYGD